MKRVDFSHQLVKVNGTSVHVVEAGNRQGHFALEEQTRKVAGAIAAFMKE